jgi:hypothetical protein
VGAGIARTVYLSWAVDPSRWDKTWIGFNSYVAGLAEANFGFICACAPSLNGLFGRFFASSPIDSDQYKTDSDSGLKRSDRSLQAMQSEHHDESLGAIEESEEVEMRFYGKPVDAFHVDDVAPNTTNSGIRNNLY